MKQASLSRTTSSERFEELLKKAKGSLESCFRPLAYSPDLWLFTGAWMTQACGGLALVFIVVFGLCSVGAAQSVALNLSSGSATPGSVVTLNLALNSTAIQPADLQWTLNFSSNDFSAVSETAASSATAAGKSISCNTITGSPTCLVYGINSATMSNGVIATVALTISPSTHSTSSTIQVTNAGSASEPGLAVSTVAAGTTVTIVQPATYTVSGTISPTVGGVGATVTLSGAASTSTTTNSSGTYSFSGLANGSYVVRPSLSGYSYTPSSASVTINGANQTVNFTAQQTGLSGATHFKVVAPSTATVGVPIQFTITALDANNNAAVTYSDPVQFSSSDASAALPVNAKPVNGVGTFPASLVTPGQQTLTAQDPLVPSITGASGSITVSAAPGLGFVPVTPCRLVDTRNAGMGGPYISGGTSRSFTIPGSCGIPLSAQVFSLNVAVVPHSVLGYITAWPTGQAQPAVSTLNSPDGRIKSNAAIIPAGTGGAVSVFATDDTDLILDIDGYFVSAATSGALAFYPLAPCRVVDTRNGTLLSGSLVGGSSRTLPIQSSNCGIPSTARAYSLNFTVVAPGQVSYLTAWPSGQTQPLTSTLNALPPLPLVVTPVVVANAAIVLAGSGGSIDVFASDPTDLVVDINGYFAPAGAGGLSLYSLPPCRVLDTRSLSGAGSPSVTGQLDVNVLGSVCGGTPQSRAYVFNATVVPSGPLEYLTLWPHGSTLPTESTLNALDGAITNNMAIVPTNDTDISSYGTNPTQLILDMFGYFAP